jgi:hypothetical protein
MRLAMHSLSWRFVVAGWAAGGAASACALISRLHRPIAVNRFIASLKSGRAAWGALAGMRAKYVLMGACYKGG